MHSYKFTVKLSVIYINSKFGVVAVLTLVDTFIIVQTIGYFVVDIEVTVDIAGMIFDIFVAGACFRGA